VQQRKSITRGEQKKKASEEIKKEDQVVANNKAAGPRRGRRGKRSSSCSKRNALKKSSRNPGNEDGKEAKLRQQEGEKSAKALGPRQKQKVFDLDLA